MSETIRDCEWCGKQPDVDLNGPWIVICGCAEDQPANHAIALTRAGAIAAWNADQRSIAIDSGKCTQCTHDQCEDDSDVCRSCRVDAEIGTSHSRAAAARGLGFEVQS